MSENITESITKNVADNIVKTDENVILETAESYPQKKQHQNVFFHRNNRDYMQWHITQ